MMIVNAKVLQKSFVFSYTGSKMKNITKILFEAGMLIMGRTSQQFELFGLDFIIDKKFQVWLI